VRVNKDNHIFSTVALLIFTVVLVFPLTLAFAGTKPIADAYWQNQHYIKTLRALGIQVDVADTKGVEAQYTALKKFKLSNDGKHFAPATDAEIIKELQGATMGNMRTFLYVTRVGEEIHYAGNFYGPGLWGNVSLAVGVNADSSSLEGVQVLYQVETPGLGGRISESWFTDQFTGLKTETAVGQTSQSNLVFNSSGQNKENGMDAITGATITSTAVKDIVNTRAIPALKELIAQIGGQL